EATRDGSIVCRRVCIAQALSQRQGAAVYRDTCDRVEWDPLCVASVVRQRYGAGAPRGVNLAGAQDRRQDQSGGSRNDILAQTNGEDKTRGAAHDVPTVVNLHPIEMVLAAGEVGGIR